jgi:hypothetical protein
MQAMASQTRLELVSITLLNLVLLLLLLLLEPEEELVIALRVARMIQQELHQHLAPPIPLVVVELRTQLILLHLQLLVLKRMVMINEARAALTTRQELHHLLLTLSPQRPISGPPMSPLLLQLIAMARRSMSELRAVLTTLQEPTLSI